MPAGCRACGGSNCVTMSLMRRFWLIVSEVREARQLTTDGVPVGSCTNCARCGCSVSKKPKVCVETLRTKSARAQFSMPSPTGAVNSARAGLPRPASFTMLGCARELLAGST